MALLLYAVTAIAILAATHLWIRPLSRTTAIVLFVLPLCFTAYALLTGRAYAPIDLPYASEPLSTLKGQYGIGPGHAGILSDVAHQMIPWRAAVKLALSRHEWPLWNPYILSGDILAAAAQPAAYSPFTLTACLLPVATSFTYSASIAFFIASIGTFLFACELGCAEIAAIAGAAAFTYCIDIAFFILWPLGVSWAFLPLVLVGTRRVVRAPSVRSTAILTIALTLMLLAGHPETALHVVFVGAVYGAFELAMWRRNIGRGLASAAVAGLLSLSICAVYVLPILEAMPQTQQQQWRAAFFATQPQGLNAPNVLARLAIDFVPALHLAKWLIPSVTDTAADTSAVGSIALALAIYAMWRVRTPQVWFFAALAVFSILARARWTPVAAALQKLPLFDVALNERFSFAAAMSLSILVAFAADDLLRRSNMRGFVLTAFVVLVFVGAANTAVVRLHIADDFVRDFGGFTAFAEVTMLAVVVMVGMAPIRRQWMVAAVIGALLIQRALCIGDLYRSFPARTAYPHVQIFDALKRDQTPFRVTGLFFSMIPNQSALYQLEDVRGYEAMTLNPYLETWRIWCTPQTVSFNRVDDLTKPFLSFLNVRYAVVWQNFAPPPGWRVFAAQRGVKLLENLNAGERAFVPRRIGFVSAPWEAVNAMTGQWDFRDKAWLEGPAAPETRNGPGTVTILRRKTAYELTADMDNDGVLILVESAWRGWRSYVDGSEVPVLRANAAFVAVRVPRGHHRVKFIYKPMSFVIGRGVTIVTLILLLAAGVATTLRRRPRTAS